MTAAGRRAGELRARFAGLHRDGILVMPNAWDVGSARLLESLGFEAVATTSSGFAATLGRMDQRVTVAELLAHAAALTDAVAIPVSVDAEHGYADTPEGVAEAVDLLGQTGVAGVSIEDYHPGSGLFPLAVAVERVAAAVEAAARHAVVLTARSENHLYGVTDLDDTITRLGAFRAVGADVVYAPGLADLDDISRLVAAVDAPVNVLLLRDGPAVPDLAAVGVRRVSTGGSLAFAAYGALAAAARELLATGTSAYAAGALSPVDRAAAFDH
ncbi:MAG: isocitrate lyase/phosphoenolpyruvate mutase family protein [Acidimicrobiia bacterium]